MRPKSILIFLSIVLWLPVIGQTSLFLEKMGNVPEIVSPYPAVSAYTGYNNYGSVTFAGARADVRGPNTNSKDYNMFDGAAASGGNYVFMNALAVNGNNSQFSITGINISGYGNLTVGFGLRLSDPITSGSFTVQVDGAGSSVTYTLPTGTTTGTWAYYTIPMTGTGTSLNITFTNTTNSTLRLDDVGVYYSIGLPVNFGNVSATKIGENIAVEWVTEQEINNDHFEILTSANGDNFKTIAIVKSHNGNSNIQQQYKVLIHTSDIEVTLAAIGLLSILGLGFNKKIRWVLNFVVTFLLICQGISCSKSVDGIKQTNKQEIFLKIKQVDIEGNTQYSKIIKVASE